MDYFKNNPGDPPRPINLNMTRAEYLVAMETAQKIFQLCHVAQMITLDQVALVMRLQAELAKREWLGQGKDIVETNRRVVTIFERYRNEIEAIMPVLRAAAAAGPLTPLDTMTVEDLLGEKSKGGDDGNTV